MFCVRPYSSISECHFASHSISETKIIIQPPRIMKAVIPQIALPAKSLRSSMFCQFNYTIWSVFYGVFLYSAIPHCGTSAPMTKGASISFLEPLFGPVIDYRLPEFITLGNYCGEVFTHWSTNPRARKNI